MTEPSVFCVGAIQVRTALEAKTGGGGAVGNGLTAVPSVQAAVGAVLPNQFYAERAIRLNRARRSAKRSVNDASCLKTNALPDQRFLRQTHMNHALMADIHTAFTRQGSEVQSLYPLHFKNTLVVHSNFGIEND
jgi:hypothetical protein